MYNWNKIRRKASKKRIRKITVEIVRPTWLSWSSERWKNEEFLFFFQIISKYARHLTLGFILHDIQCFRDIKTRLKTSKTLSLIRLWCVLRVVFSIIYKTTYQRWRQQIPVEKISSDDLSEQTSQSVLYILNYSSERHR